MNRKILSCLVLAAALVTNLVSCTEGTLAGVQGKPAGIIADRGFRPLSGRLDGSAPADGRARSVWAIENAVLTGIEDTFSRCASFQYVPFRQLRFQPGFSGEMRYPGEYKQFARGNGLELALGTTVTVTPGAGLVHFGLLVRDSDGKNVGFALAKAKGNFPPALGDIWGTAYLGEQFLPVWRQTGAEAARQALVKLQATMRP
ncbi:MAG: hypothetical protein V4662_05990 [Verrucomicrobiota bacterium]